MQLSHDEFDYIRNLLIKRAAIQLDEDKAYRVENALLPIARSEGFDSVSSLIGRLRTSPANGIHKKVVEAMTVNETTFFRDVYPFEALRKEIIPRHLEANGPAKRFDVWSAACATGQEPFSIAMLIRERFPFASVHILATDLSERVLDLARSGTYTQLEMNRGLPASFLVKYFEPVGLQWQLKQEIRRTVEFRALNLIESWSLTGPFDVVFLRNVLIYFAVETRREILSRIARILKPGGSLFLGGAETTLQLSDDFERVPYDRHAYYRRRNG